MKLKENSIIVCNQNTKKKILEVNFNQKKLFNATFFTLEEFKSRFCFKIIDQAVVFAANFLNISYKNAKIIVKNLYYIDIEEEYSDEKLIQLQSLKNELINKNLLEFDDLFIEFISGKEIYVIDLFLDNFHKELFDSIQNANVNYINQEVAKKEYKVAEFERYEDEVDYIFSEIYKQLQDGIDINNIYIVSENDEYRHLITRYSKLYKIETYLKEKESIKNHYIIKEFLNHLQNGFSKKDALAKISESNNSYIINKLIALLNRFHFVNDSNELLSILECEINNVYYEDEKKINVVNVVDISHDFSNDDYVYLLGFNNNSIPKIYKDDEYLSDKYAVILPITETYYKNKLELNRAIYLLSKIKNIYLSYSKITQSNNLISPLFDELNCEIINPKPVYGLSRDLDRLKLGTMIDDLVNFNIHNDFLNLLYSSFDDVYSSYDNRYKIIDKDLLKEKINSYIKLSYTSISTFYKCQFYYYLERVLKVKHIKENNATKIGSIFHAILEKYGQADFDLETEKQIHLSTIDDLSLKFYFEKLWPDFLLVFDVINNFKEKTYLNDELHEQEINVDYSDEDYTKIFNGKIDKIIYKQIDGVDYVSIIDYKTGSDKPSLDNVKDGFNLQLPVYAFFLAKSTLFKNPKILGIYLQKILNNCKPTKTKSLEAVKKDALKLDGFSIADRQMLSILDPTYHKSEFIKSMSITKEDVFGQYAKVYSENDMYSLIKTVEDLIADAFDKIIDGDFEINPKTINNENQSCKYCPYANICYKTNKDVVVLKEDKFSENIEGGE